MNVRRSLTDYAPTRGVCLILALGMVAWGAWVSMPFESFNAPAFELMKGLATEAVWGAFMFFGGVTFLVGVLLRDIEWIRTGAFLGFAIWLLYAVMGAVSDPSATGLTVRSTLALLHAYMWLQVKIHPELITGEVTINDLRKFVSHKGGNT